MLLALFRLALLWSLLSFVLLAPFCFALLWSLLSPCALGSVLPWSQLSLQCSWLRSAAALAELRSCAGLLCFALCRQPVTGNYILDYVFSGEFSW